MTGGIQPSSPQPLSWGELNMQTHILSVAWQKYSLNRDGVLRERPRRKRKFYLWRNNLERCFLERWKNVPASFSPALFLLSRICISGGSSSISPIPEHRQICWIFLPTSAKNKRYLLVHKFITRCWWCQRLHSSGVGHLEQPPCISSSH